MVVVASFNVCVLGQGHWKQTWRQELRCVGFIDGALPRKTSKWIGEAGRGRKWSMGVLSGCVNFSLNPQQNSAIELSPHGKMALAFHTPTPNVHWLWATRGGSRNCCCFWIYGEQLQWSWVSYLKGVKGTGCCKWDPRKCGQHQHFTALWYCAVFLLL